MAKRSDDRTIFLTGDEPLVGEWSESLQRKGFGVVSVVTSPPESAAPAKAASRTRKAPKDCAAAFELSLLNREMKKQNIRRLDAELPSSVPIIASSVTISATEQASWTKNPQRLIGIGGFPGLLRGSLVELAPSVHTSKTVITGVEDILIRLGKEIAIVQDRVGLVLPRILCSLINEAFFAVLEGSGSAEDIDLAMKLGTNYPFGPVEWAGKIGLPFIVAALDSIHGDTGDERYRVAPNLRQLALGKRWWGFE